MLVLAAPWIGLVFLAVVVMRVFAYPRAIQRARAFSDGHDRRMLKLPVLGELLRRASGARFARILSVTFGAGVPLVDALDAVAGSAGNVVYSEAIIKLKEDISNGIQLNYSMTQAGVFPNLFVKMVTIGEKSGSLDVMLGRAANQYEEWCKELLA